MTTLAFSARLVRRRTPSWISCQKRAHSVSLPPSLPNRIIFGSCSSQSEDLSYWDTIVAQQPDMTLLLGDNVYGGKDLEGLKNAYGILGAHPSFQRACRSIPILATLDDNDYGNGGDACGQNPNKDVAKRMFLDFFGVKKDDDRWQANRGVYTNVSWQEEMQVLLLDLRYDKSRFLETPDRKHLPDFVDKNKTMLGEQQWKWLEDELKKPFRVRLLVSPLQVMAEGHCWECWRMLPYERERLLSLLNKTEGTTVILSGDRHASAFYQMGRLVEVTSSSLTHTVTKGLLDNEMDATRLGDFVYCNNFGQVDIDWHSKELLITIRRTDTGSTVASKIIEMH
jgi:alkaline phosphatase D